MNTPRITYALKKITVGFIVSFYWVLTTQKLTLFTYILDGGVAFLPATASMSLFSFAYQRPHKSSLRGVWATPSWVQLRYSRTTARISFLPNRPNGPAIFARSAGTYAKVMSFDFFNHTTTIALPSGRIRRFSLYAVAAVGPVAFSEKKRLRDTRAGTNRKLGKKVLTRGVAKNPIDHPHGGRTKAIRYPRTPWGKTTKFK